MAEAFPKPLIAAVNGLGVGIGMTLLMHCDMVYISTDAKLKVPFITLGVTTEAAASLLMPQIMGWQRASEVLYTEPWLSAQDAVDSGLALKAVAPEDLMPPRQSCQGDGRRDRDGTCHLRSDGHGDSSGSDRCTLRCRRGGHSSIPERYQHCTPSLPLSEHAVESRSQPL